MAEEATTTTVSTETTAATTAAATTAAATHWTAGLDAELLGHIQNRGWHDKPAEEVAIEAIRAHREAERHIGAPADQLLRMPKPEDTAGVKAFWQKLGAPDDASKYDFSGVKFSDGSELDQGFVDYTRKLAADNNLPLETARNIAAGFVKFLDQADVAARTESTAALQAEQQALDKEWGANKEMNLFLAKQAATAAGVSAEQFQELLGTPGGAEMLKIFHFFATKMGEDNFVGAPGAGEKGAVTREQAMAQKAELMRDDAWVKSYMAGDVAKNKQMLALNALITGDSGVDYQAA